MSDTGLMDCELHSLSTVDDFCTKCLFDSQKFIRKPQTALCARPLSPASSWLLYPKMINFRDESLDLAVTSLYYTQTNHSLQKKKHL